MSGDFYERIKAANEANRPAESPRPADPPPAPSPQPIGGGIFAPLMVIIGCITIVIGFAETSSAVAESAFQQQVQALWMIKYVGLGIFCLLLAACVYLSRLLSR